MELEGTILRGRSFEPVSGRVIVEDGQITAIEETTTDSQSVIVPSFVNAHTHLGDSIAKEAGDASMSLAELVAPPDGLKHRLLRAADREELVEAMRSTLQYMAAGGTTACLEFREGGVAGVEQLRDAAAETAVDPVVLGRESIAAMEAADGFGASGANDADFSEERAATRNAEKLFAIHAGEGDGTDVDAALDLDPDLLVHMVHPEPEQMDRVEREEIPIAVCPRANLVTDVGLPPVEAHVERTTVALGTDNVMFNSPSMFREMALTAKLYDLPAEEVLAMATYRGADIAGLDCGVIAADRPAKLTILDGDSPNLTGVEDIVRAVVRRAGHADVTRVIG
jgi:cytosine/adenosine deaminase-related metal-dependent hydrolase